MNTLTTWQAELQAKIRPEKMEILTSFFKCGKGEYGEGDVFLGITVPDNRAVSTKYYDASLNTIAEMLHSEYHEYRLAALIALTERYRKHRKDDDECRVIVDFYLQNTRHINNWDLVDISCPKILGYYIISHPESKILYTLSESDNLWEQRIAIVSTWSIIRTNKFEYTLAIAPKYLTHSHDLIHKATGWMLREMGKQSKQHLIDFLDTYATQMPRTALRYAIEKLSAEERRYYMTLK